MLRYPLSCLTVCVIWFLSLMKVPEVPELEDIPSFDKLVHTAMYGGLCAVLWFEYFRNRIRPEAWLKTFCRWRTTPIERKHTLVFRVCFPILMGGALEIIQATCTGGMRSGSWWDFAANTLGVLLVWGIVCLLHKPAK